MIRLDHYYKNIYKNNLVKGRMLGILIAKDAEGEVGYFAAYSGASDEYYNAAGFITPSLTKGECAAQRLLHYAVSNNYRPKAMALFWRGDPPDSEVRHNGVFYPPVRSFRPELEKLLSGISIKKCRTPGIFEDPSEPQTVYEDRHFLIVNKPYGLLSVPGKEVTDSVQTRIEARYPEAKRIIPVHRLDLSVSGLLLIAKNKYIHKDLQRLFLERKIEKRYVALVHGCFPESRSGGVISLPLRNDLNDRPRQLVCFKEGKAAVTRWERIGCEKEFTRVYFFPLTGRSHQIRMHAAYKDGLNAPIKGDELYAYNDSGRLCLHAERLGFIHPVTGYRIEVTAPVPF